jgi:hypothetical protein
MEDEYKSLMNELKHYTELAIESVQNENYIRLNMYISDRQTVINKMSKLHCSKEELNAEFINNNIGELQTKLFMIIGKKKDAVKIETEKFLNAIHASKNYYSEIEKKAIIFSKKV